MKFNVFKLALAGGISTSIWVILLGIAGTVWHWGVPLIDALGSLYIGFKPTWIGTAFGAAWAFMDGWIGFAIIGWFYNRTTR